MSSQFGFPPPKPNDRFPGANQPTWGGDPYGSFPSPGGFPPRRRSSAWFWIFLLGGGLLATGMICCGACGGFFYFGMEVVEEEIAADLKKDPILREHLGEIQTAELNLWASFKEDINDSNNDDESWYVLDLEGTKGKGRVIGRSITNENDQEEFHDGRLILPGGREIKLSK